METPLSRKQKQAISRIHNKKRVGAILDEAAHLIREKGHCIGALRDDSGRLCLMGAIQIAATGESRAIKDRAYDAVNKAIRRPIHEWNDEQTDSERVAELLEGTAAKVLSGY